MARTTRPSGLWLASLTCLAIAIGCAKSVNNASPPGSGGQADASTGGSAGATPDAAAGAAGVSGASGAAGTSGTAGAAGADSGVGGSGGSDAGGCPSLHGPSMVGVQGQCIDSTEVTNAEYAAFVAAAVPTSGQPSYCSWNSSYTPSQGWPATGKDNYPVVYVDWCDAYAYCKWAGKRLCGDVGGGPSDYSSYALTSNQWFDACSGSGFNIYPYGATYDPSACNGVDYDAGAAQPVKQATKCEGTWPGVFDMSGNVWEWEDSCQTTNGATDQCRLRGGSYWYNGESDLRCDNGNANDRKTQNDIVGFRCCAP